MVSVLDFRSNSLGLSPGQGHCVLIVPLSTQVHKWISENLLLGGNPAMDKHPIQGGVENNTASRFVLLKLG